MGLFSRRPAAPDDFPVAAPNDLQHDAGDGGDAVAHGAGSSMTSRFSSLWSRSGASTPARRADPAADVVPADGLKPSAMRRSEPLYGYLVGLELLFVAVLNLTVTHGKGAPAHPETTLAAVGVVASIAYMALIYYTKNRMAAGFGAIVAAFFVTLPPVPSNLAVAHICALVIPMAYGLIITQRQRKDTPRVARGRGAQAGSGRSSGGGSARGAGTGAGGRRGRRGRAAEPASGPRPSARYTPPKSKRQPTKK